MISHFNVIANTLQVEAYDRNGREGVLGPDRRDVALGLLPQSHIYSLIFICHASTFRGDQVIILPKFNMEDYLLSIARYHITTLYVVPPIVVAMVKSKVNLERFDLSSVKKIVSAAAPLGEETAEDLRAQYPQWRICQAYGLTETCVVVCSTSPSDIWFGSSGSLLPGIRCRLVSAKGKEIEGHDERGELLVSSPTVTLGYLRRTRRQLRKPSSKTYTGDG